MNEKKKIFSFLLFFCSLCLGLILSRPVNAATKAKISANTLTLKIGQSKQLYIKNLSKKQTNRLKWNSSKKTVATVNSKGKVTAKQVGSTTVTAKVGNKQFICKVTVAKNINYKLSGVIKTKSGSLLKSPLFKLEFINTTTNIPYQTDYNSKTGKFSTYIPVGKYTAYASTASEGYFDKYEISTITMPKRNMTLNISLKNTCISAKLLRAKNKALTDTIVVRRKWKNGDFWFDNTLKELSPDKNGNILWLIDNSITLKAEENKSYVFSVMNNTAYKEYDIISFDNLQNDKLNQTWKCNLYKISGYITNNGSKLKKDFGISTDFETEYIKRLFDVIYEENCTTTGIMSIGEDDAMSFELYAEPGTYFLQTGLVNSQKFTVTNKDITDCEIAFQAYYVKIRLEQDESTEYMLESDSLILISNETKHSIYLSGYSDPVLVEAGSYTVKAKKYDSDELVELDSFMITNQHIDKTMHY